MAIKGRKFSKQHLANLRAAHAKRRKPTAAILREAIITAQATSHDLAIGDKVTFNHDKGQWTAVEQPKGLIDRMTQAIDKIKEQIERLETL